MHRETVTDWDWDSVLLLANPSNLPWDDDGGGGADDDDVGAANSSDLVPLSLDQHSNSEDPRLSCPNYLAGRIPCACTDTEEEHGNEGGRKRIKVSSRCQVPNCGASLAGLKGYHQRHRVCVDCANATTVMLENGPHRYCQQCGKFHTLLYFDEGKRSCKRKLERHNNRRRRRFLDTGNLEVPTQSSDKGIKSGSSPFNDISRSSVDGKSSSPLVEKQTLDTSASHIFQTDEQHSSLITSATNKPGDLQAFEPSQNGYQFGDHPGNGPTGSQLEKQMLDKGGLVLPGIPLEGIFSNETASDVASKASEQVFTCNKSGPSEQSSLGLLMEDGVNFDNPPHCQRTTGQDHFSEAGRVVHPSISSSGLRRQSAYISPCPTRRISFKFYDWNPADFPRRLRQQILEWLAHMPVELEGYIRAGCTLLTLFVAMSETSWNKVSKNWSDQILQLICQSESGFWDMGSFIAYLDNKVTEVHDGNVSVRLCKDDCFNSSLHYVRPICLEAGSQAEVTVFGNNLEKNNARIVVSSAGKCVAHYISNLMLPSKGVASSVLHSDACVCIPLLTPEEFGTVYIEVEGSSGTSNFLPVIIADKDMCTEIRTLEQELCTSKMTLDIGTDKALNHSINDLLLDLGWVLRPVERQCIEKSDTIDYLERLRRLLTFSIERGWYSTSKQLLEVALMAGLVEGIGICEDGFTALHMAALHNHVDVLQLLMKFGSEYEQGVDATCSKGFWWHADFPGPENLTVLHIIGLREGTGILVDVLTKNKRGILAWEQAKDCHGISPRQYAMLKDTSYNDIVCQNAMLLIHSNGHSESLTLNNVSSFNERSISIQHVLVSQQQTSLADRIKDQKQVTKKYFPGIHLAALFHRPSTHTHNNSIKTRRVVVTTLGIFVVCTGVCIVLQRPNQIVQITMSLRHCLGHTNLWLSG